MFATSIQNPEISGFLKYLSGYNQRHNTMTADTFNPQEFYSRQGQISDPGGYTPHLDALPADIPGIIQVIQGVMLHMHWASRYGITLNRVRQEEANLRTIRDRLAKILALQEVPLTEPRPLTKKTVGTCRDFALLLTAILRHQGIPTRARAGFGTYFTPDRYEDHWVCEYWHPEQARWVMVDPQIDALQCEALSIDFDPLHMPEGKFVTGGQAWRLCQSKAADPQHFGIFDFHGLDFIKGNVIRDFLALNKIEILPWDDFKLIDKSLVKMDAPEKALIDRLALISSGEDRDFVLLRAAFLAHQEDLLPDYFFSSSQTKG
jgi:hypothetical protein